MNKAFVREPDSTDEFCPRCGTAGQSVARELVARFVREPAQLQIAEIANFCPTPTCPVAYFDSFERTVLADALTRPVYPKDPSAPLCVCFGLTADDIERDLDEGGVARTKACLLQAQSSAVRCHELAANGRSCIPDVQKYFLQRKNARSGTR